MNQSEFAALMGVHQGTVTRWKDKGWLVMAGDCEVDPDASKARLLEMRGTLGKLSATAKSKRSAWSRGPHCKTHRAFEQHRRFNGG
jgi:hypothetical protein